MFDLLNEFYKSAFMTEQFSNIRREFEATTKYDLSTNRKKLEKILPSKSRIGSLDLSSGSEDC